MTDTTQNTILGTPSAEPTAGQATEQPGIATPQEAQAAPVLEATITSFKDMLSEDLRADKSLADFKDLNGLAKSYINLQKLQGSSIRIPSQEAGAEDFNEFYKKLEGIKGVMRTPDTTDPNAMKDFYAKLGRPAAPESYKFDLPDADADKLGLKADLDSFKKFSYEMGLTNDQANALAKARIDSALKQKEQSDNASRKAEEVLKQKWGQDYDNRVKGAKIAVNYLSDQFPSEVQELLSAGAGNNPLLISILSEYGRGLVETGALKNSSSVKYGVSREDALNVLQDINRNPKHLANAPVGTPGREEALAERERLARIAYDQ